MPVIIHRAPTPPPRANPRRQRFDDAVRELAPIIAEIRKAGYQGIGDILVCLEDKGLPAPSGGCFTYETTRRILKRIKKLGLGDGPRSNSEALAARHRKTRALQDMELERACREVNELRAQQRRESPDWPTTRPWLR
jgi:hypothetical protein